MSLQTSNKADDTQSLSGDLLSQNKTLKGEGEGIGQSDSNVLKTKTALFTDTCCQHFITLFKNFERECRHLKINQLDSKTKQICENRPIMDDENDAQLDVVFKNCKNDFQLVSG